MTNPDEGGAVEADENIADLDRVPIGTRIRIVSPGAWYDDLCGRVHHYPREYRGERVTISLEGTPPSRALAFVHELRVISDA